MGGSHKWRGLCINIADHSVGQYKLTKHSKSIKSQLKIQIKKN